MVDVLIVYATREGQTGKIARYMAERARREGCRVELHDADRQVSSPWLETCQAVIVTAPIHARGYPRSISRFVARNKRLLERVRSAFCSVGLAVASRTTDGRSETMPIVEKFLTQTGWHPTRVELMAGALKYSQYNPLIRFIMRRIAARAGGDLDTSRDYEYTDWAAVDRFVREFVSRPDESRRAAG